MLRERFLITYAVAVLGTAAIMSALEMQKLEVHYSLYVVEFLVLLEFLAPYKKSLSRVLEPVGIALFLGLCYIIALIVI
jgi:Ca2+/Na+ antiporter